jgi:hypothetical protein
MTETVRLRLRLDDLGHTVSPEMLDRFAARTATRGERRVVARHLLEGCSSCSRRLARFLPMAHVQEPESAYDRAFDRGLERALGLLKLQSSRNP